MIWAESHDRQLRSLAGETNFAGIAKQMNLPLHTVWHRALRLNVKALSLKQAKEPSIGEWLGCAQEAALDAHLSVRVVLSHCARKRASLARWKAWRACLAAHPEYSIAGVARTSGFTHGAIIRGLRRLEKLESAK